MTTDQEDLDLLDIKAEVISLILEHDKMDIHNDPQLRSEVKMLIKKVLSRVYDTVEIIDRFDKIRDYVVCVVIEREGRCEGEASTESLPDPFFRYLTFNRKLCCRYHLMKLCDTAQRCYDILIKSSINTLVTIPTDKELRALPLCLVIVKYRDEWMKKVEGR